ncbi:ABC transporter substrate-binding protein [Enterovirga sp. CN4-39]|uniref:ABC transporter substrate-binding protein n=1 Tax=Enterovirga sp. CN4-39 TaxID=3400910 RepID=UPI003C0CC6A9
MLRKVLGRALMASAFALGPVAMAAAQDKTVKIGVLTDMSGFFSTFGGRGSVEAAKMAAEEFNGVVAGRKIEILFADHQNKPDIASTITRQWFDLDKVDAVADLPGTATALAALNLARAQNKMVLISGSASSELTGKSCLASSFQWTFDTYSQAHGAVSAVVKQGLKKWFFITADYIFGHDQERMATEELTRLGGEVVGSVRVPLDATDYGSFILKAQASGANVLALATSSGTITAMRQGAEFGLPASGVRIVPMNFLITQAHALGPEITAGSFSVTAFYWGKSPESREWSKRFFQRVGAMPTDIQAGVYSSVRHYLKAIEAAGTTDTLAVAAKMREMPVNDIFATDGRIRSDGRMVQDLLLLEAKPAKDVKEPWDYFVVKAKLPSADVFMPERTECPLVKK